MADSLVEEAGADVAPAPAVEVPELSPYLGEHLDPATLTPGQRRALAIHDAATAIARGDAIPAYVQPLLPPRAWDWARGLMPWEARAYLAAEPAAAAAHMRGEAVIPGVLPYQQLAIDRRTGKRLKPWTEYKDAAAAARSTAPASEPEPEQDDDDLEPPRAQAPRR